MDFYSPLGAAVDSSTVGLNGIGPAVKSFAYALS